jgi:isochorismate hydrolase
MKESYFTAETLQAKADEYCNQLAPNRRSRLSWFVPVQSVLLVLDMQDYFLNPVSHAYIPSASAIVPGLQALVGAFARRGRPVIFTRHLNTSQDAGRMAGWWRELLSEANPLSAITKELDLEHGVTVVKTQYDAFYNTPLEDVLHSRQTTQVVVCGVMTHLCCETTARAAFVRGFDVFFTVDGTATYTEAHHRATLLNLSHGFAVPVLVDEIVAACQNASDETI